MKSKKRQNIKSINIIGSTRNSAILRSDQLLQNERSRYRAQRKKLCEEELQCNLVKSLKSNDDILACIRSLEDAKKGFMEEYDHKLQNFYQQGKKPADTTQTITTTSVCSCEKLSTGLEILPFVMIHLCSKEEPASEHPLALTIIQCLSQLEEVLSEDTSEITFKKLKVSSDAGLVTIIYELLNWTSKFHVNSSLLLLPTIIELLAYRILRMLANLICIDYQPFMKEPFLTSLHTLLLQPATLRTKQLAYLCLCEIAEASPLSSLTLKNDDAVTDQLTIAKEIITYSYALASGVMSNEALLFDNQIHLPFGGSDGMLRVIFRFLATTTQFETADICDLILIFAQVHVNFLLIFLKQTSTILQLSADHDQRATFSELLWIFSNCLTYYFKDSTRSGSYKLNFEVLSLATSVWELLRQCFCVTSQTESPAAPLTRDNEAATGISSIVYHLPLDVLTRLNLERTDLLIPGFVLLRQLCEVDFQILNKQFVLDQLLELEQNAQKQHNTFLLGVIGKGLMSQHGRLVLESCVILSLIAKIRMDKHLQFVSLFLPVLLALLVQKQQYYLVKRAIVIILIEVAFTREGSLFETVLNCDPLSIEKFNSATREIFPHNNLTELQMIDEIPVCFMCQKVSVIDAIVTQFNKDQQDLVLIDLCFDFLDKALSKMPSLKEVLLKHDIINVVESVQFLNDENLFQNSIRFVEKYYDDTS